MRSFLSYYILFYKTLRLVRLHIIHIKRVQNRIFYKENRCHILLNGNETPPEIQGEFVLNVRLAAHVYVIYTYAAGCFLISGRSLDLMSHENDITSDAISISQKPILG